MNELPVTRAQIGDTYESIAPFVRMTPTVEIAATDFGLADFRCIFKLEFMQYAGSFKARGAFANLLHRRIPPVGVVAASGGNHGAAVAFAAQRLNRQARIYVPAMASPAKLARIRESGAELIVGGERYADALEASQRWAEQSGALQIHAYDQPETLRGQGTVGVEWEDQVPDLDCLLLAVGGGGLLGGVAAWYEERLRVIGVEPESAPTLTRAIAAGGPVDAPAGGIRDARLARPEECAHGICTLRRPAIDSPRRRADHTALARGEAWQPGRRARLRRRRPRRSAVASSRRARSRAVSTRRRWPSRSTPRRSPSSRH